MITRAISAEELTAGPDPRVARILRRALNEVLVADLRRYCDVAAKALPEAANTAKLGLAQIDPMRRLSPFLFSIHQDLRAALVDRDRAKVLIQLDHLTLLAQAGRQHFDGVHIRSYGLASEDAAMAGVIAVSDEAGDLIDSPPRAVSAGALGATVRATRAGLRLLRTADPELAGEVDELVCQIVLADGGPQGITSLKCFGSVQIRRPRDCDAADAAAAVVYLAENIAHENSHLMMYAMMNVDPMLRNGEIGRYVSPLRHDPRPLYGIFHATFVLARLTRLYANLTHLGTRGAAALRDEQHAKFLDGYATLDRHGDFTPVGRRLLDAAFDLAS